MSNLAHGAAIGGPVERPAQPGRTVRQKLSEWLLVLSLPALFLIAWLISIALADAPNANLDYYLGLAGGLMMLALFLYPLRKHFRFMHGWGPTKYWFGLHMILGIGGPLVILVHSKFHIGSLNAGVALTCMLIVMLSGVMGRFIYIRIHHGLYGQRATLKELQILVGLNSIEVRSKLHFAPEAEEALIAFEKAALAPHKGFFAAAWAFMTLWWRGRKVYRRCRRALVDALAEYGERRGWDRPKLRKRQRSAKRLARAYIANTQRVAHFSIYERLFSLWHIAHVPLVYMLLASAAAHVVAVHMY